MSVASDIEEYLRAEIAPDADALTGETDLLADGVVDSLGIVQLIEHLERRYGIAVGDEDLTPENFRSIDAIAAFVEARGGG